MTQGSAADNRAGIGSGVDGPRILFFSGGTALRGTSRELARHTRNSVHVITPFDSGGSSAVLRRAFAMPAVGDIRNRLMALADLSEKGGREIFALFTYRFSKKETNAELAHELHRMADGEHVLISLVPEEKRADIREHLHRFLSAMPEGFNLQGASIGNIVLTAGYLTHRRRLAPVINHFSRLARVQGVVRPVVDEDYHLAAELEDGTVLVGQHLLTGKEVGPLSSKVRRVWLTASLDDPASVTVPVSDDVRSLIGEADLICFPIGSFYSSVVANCLPTGVGRAVAGNPCPKVFIPNPGGDPELLGHSVTEQVDLLRRYLVRSGAPDMAGIITHVLIDRRADYPGGVDIRSIEAMGIRVVDSPLLKEGATRHFASNLLAHALISLAD